MTASHTDGSKAFGHHIDGCQNEQRIQESFQISAEAGGLDLMVSNEHKYYQCPAKFGHQVGGRAPEAQHADGVGHHAGHKDGAYQRDIAVEAGAHIIMHKLDQAGDCHFCHGLPAGNAGDLQPGTQPDTQCRDQDHDQPAHGYRLCDADIAQQGNILKHFQDFCTIDGNIHIDSPHRYSNGSNFKAFQMVFLFILLRGFWIFAGARFHQRTFLLQEQNNDGRIQQRCCSCDYRKERQEKCQHHPAGLQNQTRIIAQLHLCLHSLLIGHTGRLLHGQAQNHKAKQADAGADDGGQGDSVSKGQNAQKMKHCKAAKLDCCADQAALSHSLDFFFRSRL